MKTALILITTALTATGIAVTRTEANFQKALAAWDAAPLQIPLFGAVSDHRPERDFPWEALLGAIALGGGAAGFVLSGFNQIDKRQDSIEMAILELKGLTEQHRLQREASLLLLQREMHALENALKALQAESDRHDRRLYRAVENLTDALQRQGIFRGRSRTETQHPWPTDDPPTDIGFYRPPTPPPGEPP